GEAREFRASATDFDLRNLQVRKIVLHSTIDHWDELGSSLDAVATITLRLSMGKKSKHKDDGAVNLALIINFLSLGLMTVLIFMPYWQFSPMIPALSFPQRNIGLFKASGKYTPVLRTAADLTWIQIRSSTCDVAMAEQGLPKQSVASVITAVTGSECPPICLFQLNLRCQFYRIFFYLNFLVAALVVLGPLISFLASVMPLIVKERKSDRFLYFLICASGAAAASTGLIVYAGFSTYMYSKFNQYGYYPSPSLSICFYVAVAGALMLCGSSFVLYGRHSKFTKAEEEKERERKAREAAEMEGGYDPGILTPGCGSCFRPALGALLAAGTPAKAGGGKGRRVDRKRMQANGAGEGVVWPSTEEDNKSSAASGSTLTRTGGSDRGSCVTPKVAVRFSRDGRLERHSSLPEVNGSPSGDLVLSKMDDRAFTDRWHNMRGISAELFESGTTPMTA
ncbi:hypothetical protein FOZ62_024835, partial [Perkinsus olseni]